MKKRTLSILAVMALLIASLTATALADVDITSADYRNTISQKAKDELAPVLASNPATVEALCPVCNEKVIWRAVSITEGSVSGYHFTGEHRYLTADLDATSYFRVTSGSGCFYLNGHNITSSSVAFDAQPGCTVNIIGNGTETVSGKNYGSSHSRIGATLDVCGGTLNLFGGTYTKDNTVAGPVLANRKSAGTINIYNGTTITGGVNSDLGGNIALHVGGAKLNVYGGEISNGQGTQGGNIAVNGDGNCQVNISGGTITSGKATKADGRGGNIVSYYGDINVSGGRIESGSAYIGGNITVIRSGAELKISGNATITGGKAQHGGNIRTQESAVMTMSGGTVSNGTASGAATSQGGNINVGYGTTLTVSGGTISGGSSTDAGGNIYSNDACSINISGTANITGGTANATGGGTLSIHASTLTMTGGTITGGTGKLGAAIYLFGKCTANVSGGTITGGTANDGGAVRIQDGAVFTLSGGTVTGGTATSQGGNFSLKGDGTTLTVSGGEITGGTSTNQGGNIYANPGTAVNVSGGTVSGGKASNSYGGNMALDGATLTMTTGTISGGQAYVGGSLYLFGGAEANVSGGTINGGTAVDGGAVRMQGGSKFTLSNNGVVTGGTATSQGGNFCLKESGTKLTISGGSVTGGTSTNQGGNIYCNPGAVVSISGGSISGGKSNNSNGGNLAMENATLTVTGGAFSGGEAGGNYGGNIYLFGGSTGSISGATFSGGTASTGANIYHSGALTLTNCTLTNTAGYSIVSDADLTLKNTAVSGTYIYIAEGKLTLSGNSQVKGVTMKTEVAKLHVAVDFTGTASIDAMEKPTEPFYTGVMDENRYTSGGNFTGIVKLGDAAMQPQLHGVDGKLVVSAVRLQNYNTGAYVWYLDAEAAILAYDALSEKTGYYVHLACPADVVVPAGKTAYINFNGETPANVTVGDGAKLYAYDSSYDAGKLSYSTFNTDKLEKAFTAPNGVFYVAIPYGEGKMKTAAVEVTVTGVSLRTTNAGMYYSATVNCAAEAKEYLTCGIAVQLMNAPGADFKTTSLYTAQSNVTDNINGVLIQNILKEGATTKERADSVIYAVAYVECDGASQLSAAKSYSLTDVMSLLDADIDYFSAAQKKVIKAFYDKYAEQVGWQFTGIVNGTKQTNGEGDVLKVLTLGHSLALDSNHMLTRIAAAEGYDGLQIGTLYYAGCYLSRHVEFLKNDAAVYNLHISSTETPDTPPKVTQKVTMEYALEYDYWDIIVMQGGVFEIADDSAFKNGNIQTIQAYVREKCLNPNVKFAWHMHWAPPVTDYLRDTYDGTDDYYNKNYAAYNNDRAALYRTNVKRVQDNILTDNTFRFVIPTGTAMENALSSYLEELDLHRDYVHASDLARVMNAYLWYCKLTGVNQLTELKMDTIPVAFFESTEGTQDRVLTNEEKAIILEAVNNALKTPYEVTQSKYVRDELQIGYSKVNITPDFAVCLGGYGDYENRQWETVMDQLYLTCIAATEGEQTVLMYTCDSLYWDAGMANDVRPLITAATGVPGENIFFSATHTHGAPMAQGTYTGSQKYYGLLKDWAVEAAENALADQSKALVYTGSKQIEGMNFVRHYVLTDGTYMGSNYNETDKNKTKIKDHAAQPDQQMTLIKFERFGSKKDVLMVNWQAHADSTSENGKKVITADYPGDMRDALENKTGMEVAYFTGAGGNTNKNSWIAEKAHSYDRKQYGEALADEAYSILKDLKPMRQAGIKVKGMNSTVNVDHTWDSKVSSAESVLSYIEKGNDWLASETMKYYGFSSKYHASTVIDRSKMSATDTMQLRVFSIGDIGFVNGTYEMFSENALFIKENSPFTTTFIMEGNYRYLPSEAAHNYGCYEVDTGYYLKGTAENLADEFVNMLNQLKK